MPKSFISGAVETPGFEFFRLDYSEDAYLYIVDTGKTTHYEVFKRIAFKVCVDFKERIYSDTRFKDRYPRARDFGLTAWTYPSIEQAREKFNELNQKQ